MLRHVADNVGLVDALGEEQAVVVGHDWGAPIAWNSALLRPDVFRAVAGLSVPFAPAGDTRPTDAFRRDGRRRGVLHRVLPAARPGRGRARGGRAPVAARLLLHRLRRRPAADRRHHRDDPAGGEMRDRFAYPDTMPAWLTDADLDFYAGEFERTGFTGGLNRYRNVDRDWEDLAGVPRPADQGAGAVRRRRQRRPDDLGQASIDRFPRRCRSCTAR